MTDATFLSKVVDQFYILHRVARQLVSNKIVEVIFHKVGREPKCDVTCSGGVAAVGLEPATYLVKPVYNNWSSRISLAY